jgi:hypothetical protein
MRPSIFKLVARSAGERRAGVAVKFQLVFADSAAERTRVSHLMTSLALPCQLGP